MDDQDPINTKRSFGAEIWSLVIDLSGTSLVGRAAFVTPVTKTSSKVLLHVAPSRQRQANNLAIIPSSLVSSLKQNNP